MPAQVAYAVRVWMTEKVGWRSGTARTHLCIKPAGGRGGGRVLLGLALTSSHENPHRLGYLKLPASTGAVGENFPPNPASTKPRRNPATTRTESSSPVHVVHVTS